ncbi:MAG: ATP-binding protein [Oscillochloris sp.]|nr:ATP-binding protein [Oscillochloris sp.]
MEQSTRERLAAALGSLQTNDPSVRQAIRALGDVISTGDIVNSTGIAIGSHIKQVVQHFNLPSEVVAALLDLRARLVSSLGQDTTQYRWGNLVVEKLQDFVGREYVFTAINDFLANRSSGYFIIEGDPGMGKSTLLAEYVRRTGCLVHFNVRALGISSVSQFLQNICTQIILDTNLPYTHLPQEATRDGGFLLQLLRQAAERLAPGKPLVIAVDALDEVNLASEIPGANILCLPSSLPDNVYFILTRRRVDLPLVIRTPQQTLDLMAYPAENRHDIETYLRNAVDRPALQAWIVDQQVTIESFIALLAERSENNFMYVRYVLPEIEQGMYVNTAINILPKGLEGYYEDHWVRMGMTAKPLPRAKIRIIYIMCELRRPVSIRLIANFASNTKLAVDEMDIQEVLLEWRQFLHEQIAPNVTYYNIYHASFQDFLHRKDIVQKADVTIPEINALIADRLWSAIYGEDEEEDEEEEV